jgi:hypothetical protein
MTLDDFLKNYQPAGTQKKDYGIAGSVLGGLGALYNGNQAIESGNQYLDSLGQNQAAIQARMNSMPTLDAMYGENSPYATQLRETLARQDAKAGRNSQYGPRAVQLQAALADKGSSYAAQQAQVAEMLSKASNATNEARQKQQLQNMQIRGQQLGSLFDIGDKSGLLNPLNNFLGGMVDKGLGAMFPQQPERMPQAQDYSQGGPSMGYYGGSEMPQETPYIPEQQTFGNQELSYNPNDNWANNSGSQQLWYE